MLEKWGIKSKTIEHFFNSYVNKKQYVCCDLIREPLVEVAPTDHVIMGARIIQTNYKIEHGLIM